MDDSPRTSKRRKIETPKRIALGSLAKTPAKTPAKSASGRLATRPASDINDEPAPDEAAQATPKRGGRLPKGATKSTPAKRAAEEDIDIYDDIEGALSVQPSPRPTRAQLQAASRDNTSGTGGTDDLQVADTTPKRRRGRPSKAESASHSALRNIVTGYKAKTKAGTDAEDELAEEAPSPTKRPKAVRTPAASVRKPAAPRSSGRKKKEQSLEEEEDSIEVDKGVNGTTPTKSRSTRKTPIGIRKATTSEDEEAVVGTPSRSAKRRQPVASRAAVPDTDDELASRPPPSAKKLTASARRRLNRTDHIGNDDEGHLSDVEIQTNGHDEDDMDVDGNSVVGSLLDPTEPSPFNKPTSAQKAKEKERLAPTLIYGDFAAGRELDLLKTIVMERITGNRPSPLVGLDEEHRSVYQVVEHTITAGEGNSMLVIGARGSGKTALVNKVLSEVAKNNGGEYHVVRLNGFVHTDDKIALREIWRQLGKEMDIEEDGSGPGKNYADTLTTLLALLSHPSEQTGEVTDQVAKAVIFVMDEFDLFAQHPRQTLLYNLFDIAQSRKAPIAVLGLTTRIDVTNSLEKRVKSRFSHRYVHLSLAKTFTAFQEICKACLLVHAEHLSVEERGILEGGIKTTPAKKDKKSNANTSNLAEWNTNINVSPLPSSHPQQFLI